MLFASAPSEATGRWTSLDDDAIDVPSDANTGVSGLEVGENRFVWTLSYDDCPNYSADTVTVTQEAAPIAGNDQITLDIGESNRNINVLANDQFRQGANLNISIISDPVLGNIGAISGNQVPFNVGPGISGEDEFTYQVCIDQCVELCDSAIVKVTIPFDANFEVEAPNGITPNGDGLNDQLVFDILQNAPEQFEENEIVIFNRWGDIVYTAAPYTNEWGGKNSGGQDLPSGTYYYILRLNINEGQIIRGDVTIVR
jgi:gliding motility-associated-like protein